MDPLTHTLVGGSLAATSLGGKTRRAGLALVIGANLPDIDVLSFFWGSDAALGFRRGWTHGLPALVFLPALLAVVLRLWPSSHRVESGSRPPTLQWLVGLSYLAVLTHPTLDWLNNYGMRWWMPLRDTWYYGDSVFIMDPWLWLVLGGCWLLGRKPTHGLVLTWAIVAALLLSVVASRAPSYTAVVALLFLGSIFALLKKPQPGRLSSGRAGMIGLSTAMLYIVTLLALHGLSVHQVRAELARLEIGPVDDLMVGPMPANPFAWNVVALEGASYRVGRLSWLDGGTLSLSQQALTDARSTDLWREIEASGQSPGFLQWVRFPWLEMEVSATERHVYLMDARYTRRRLVGFGATEIILPVE